MPRLTSVATLADATITVRDLMEGEGHHLEPQMAAAEGYRYLLDRGFDAAPLAAERVTRYVTMEDLCGKSGSVMDHSLPLDTRVLATERVSAFAAVELLKGAPFFFVLEGTRVIGIVTRAELQKEPISLLLLGFILSAERAINAVVRMRFGDDVWLGLLSDRSRGKVEEVFEDRRRNNVAISRLECLMLHDRLAIIGKQRELREELGYGSRKDWELWVRALRSARDGLAHGGDLLGVRQDPLEAIQLFIGARDFANRLWHLAESMSLPHSA